MRPLHLWLLAGLVVVILVNNALWLSVDRKPTDMDQGRYMLMVHEFADGWSQPDGELVASLWRGNNPTHPHLVPLLASVPFSLTGRHADAAYYVNTLFHAGLVVLLFLLGLRQRDAVAGLLAATLATGLPMLSRFSRFFLLEEAATFFVVAALYCLLRSRRLSHTGWSAATGLAVGFALLTKWTTVVFVVPPIGWVAAAALLRQRSLAPLARLAAAIAGTLVVAGPWYLARWRELTSFFAYAEQGLLFAGDGPGWGQLWFYLWNFWIHSGWPFSLLALAGLAYLCWQRDSESQALLTSVLVPLATFAFLLSTRDVRHMLPAVPVLLLGAALALRSLPTRFSLRRGLTAAVAAFALVSVVQSAWGLREGGQAIRITGAPSLLVLPDARPPDPRDHRFVELLDAAVRDSERPTTRVVVQPANLPFRANGFVFLAAEHFPQLKIEQVPFYIPPDRLGHRHVGADQLIYDGYLLTREGDINGSRNQIYHYAKALQQFLLRSGHAEQIFPPIYSTVTGSSHVAQVRRVERPACDDARLDYLDWADELDPDDPGILLLVERCANPGAPPDGLWHTLAESLRARSTGGGDVARLRELAARHPRVRWIRRLLADALHESGDRVAAAEAYGEIGDGAPYLCSPSLAAAGSWHEAGRPAEAREALERALVDTPDCPQAHLRLAALLDESGEAEAAQRERRKVGLFDLQAAIGPRDTPEIRLQLGMLALAGGQTEEAVQHFEAGLRSAPDHAELKRRLRELAAGRQSTATAGETDER